MLFFSRASNFDLSKSLNGVLNYSSVSLRLPPSLTREGFHTRRFFAQDVKFAIFVRFRDVVPYKCVRTVRRGELCSPVWLRDWFYCKNGAVAR